MSEADHGFAASWRIVELLVAEGVEHACVSPGSRSTPIALALWRHPHVRVHVHLDERASAFTALGIAKATDRPVAVACTSGTAVAELFPAVVEASMSRTPLVVLTADRPPELRGVGANQTIDQPGIFGSYVRASVDLAVPDGGAVDASVRDALAAMADPPPGPVHLNLPFREPLVPTTTEPPMTRAPRAAARPITGRDPRGEDIEALVDAFASTERGLVLAGSLRRSPGASLVTLAERARWPLIAEPTSGVRLPGALTAATHLLADAKYLEAHPPEIVVQVGAAPTSRAALELVRGAGRLVIVDPDLLVADPHRRASLTIAADAVATIDATATAVAARDETRWWWTWHRADATARRAVDEVLDRDDEPFEGRLARDLATSLSGGSTLVVGSSTPVRDLDAYARPREGFRVLANRGASGIDGFVATTLGVAVGSDAPTTGLCGDLTFLYDAGALLWSARRGARATIVVANNGGGAIFSLLPQRELPELDDLFVTPHGLDLAGIAAAAGAGHHLVRRSSDLAPVVAEAHRGPGVQVVEVAIDAAFGALRREEVRGAVAAALRSEA